MLSLPVELRLPIIHHARDSFSGPSFQSDAVASIEARTLYKNTLLAISLYHGEWKAVAQVELFRDLIVSSKKSMRLLLEQLRGREEFRLYTMNAISISLGGRPDQMYDSKGLKEDLIEIGSYCPNITEVSCSGLDASIDYFKGIKRLEQLNFFAGSLTYTRDDDSILPITSLSLNRVEVDLHFIDLSQFRPSSIPLVRSLHLSNQAERTGLLQAYFQNQITAIYLDNLSIRYVMVLLRNSSSLTFLSLDHDAIDEMDAAGLSIIKDRILTLRICIPLDCSLFKKKRLLNVISGSKVLKEVILFGKHGRNTEHATGLRILSFVRSLKAACLKKDIELSKENFTSDNGKVDLSST